MTRTADTTGPALPRPAPATDLGPLDDRFYEVVEGRFRRLLRDNPVAATYFGIHDYDDELGDGGRETVLNEIAADRADLATIEALDPAGLSAAVRFERDLELHNINRSLFEADELRIWERRSLALDTIGDGLFLLFARDHAPLAERLDAIAGRLEAVPAYLDEARDPVERATGPALATDRDRIRPDSCPPCTTRWWPPGGTCSARPSSAGWSARPRRRQSRSTSTRRGSRAPSPGGPTTGRSAANATTGWSSCARSTASMRTPSWSSAIRSSPRNARRGRAAAHEIDPEADELEVVARVKADHATTFADALDGYRTAMQRARAYLIERELVTVPDDERIDVIETPQYLRNVIPFAAYFAPAPFDASAKGIYVVTQSVHDDPKSILEHNRASISNTSIHEAYPGHHLQMDIARRHPSLTRLLADAPEFIEGWGMYSELMMREQGFDDAPEFRVMLHTDAIWRACRIILDVQLHRGEISVDEGVDFLVEQTRFGRDNARSEVEWYTYRPTYPLSYLLGRTLLVELREAERRRQGDAFSLRAFHDTLLRNGSLPLSFHRRLLAGEVA